jgi:cytochrome c oxidase assembly protein subunit 11
LGVNFKMLTKQRKKLITLVALSGILVGMGSLVAAAQPLYEIFCQITGYGGTTQTSDQRSSAIGEREIVVQFNADVAGDLPWKFKPDQREIRLKVGENKLAFYSATNLSGEPVIGSATFNVTPQKAGLYFNKIDCFCFEEQLLLPGQTLEMPVTFFVDPDIDNDNNLDEVRTITLSYTFFDLGTEYRERYLDERNTELTRYQKGKAVLN